MSATCDVWESPDDTRASLSSPLPIAASRLARKVSTPRPMSPISGLNETRPRCSPPPWRTRARRARRTTTARASTTNIAKLNTVLQGEINGKHEQLMANVANLNSLDDILHAARLRVDALSSSARRVRQELADPYHAVVTRTHQLRVHMAGVGCPLVGDKLYGVADEIFLEHIGEGLSDSNRAALVLDRHALHAHRLRFHHPFRDEAVEFEAPLPADMAALVDG